ncbi:hypothetical protein NFI96_002838 [Prochilodus magdalenae]|nr:hypothetical protein NFI96_002838 [Prochilodus magdalenae]
MAGFHHCGRNLSEKAPSVQRPECPAPRVSSAPSVQHPECPAPRVSSTPSVQLLSLICTVFVCMSSSPADDLSDPERVPDVPPRPKAHQKSPKKSVPPPPSQSSLLDSSDSSDEYEDMHTDKCGNGDPLEMAEKTVSACVSACSTSLMVPSLSKVRYSSLCSDDELLDDDSDLCYETVPDKRDLWIEDYDSLPSSQNSIYLPITGRVLAQPPKADPAPHLTPVIKMGWLDKNPPQGSLIYQRRWVKLDADYLRYFDNEKEVYSKRIIPTTSITGVANVGDQKFEVVTHNRTFLFRAESDSERNEWVSVLQDMAGPARARVSRDLSLNPMLSSEMKGYLELRGLRSKLYTVVCGDKVFLYKSTEVCCLLIAVVMDYRLGIGITSIDMNVGNVKDMDRRAFDLTTPYRIFSFVAETDQLKDQWVEAMRNSIAEALSNYEVAEKIWGKAANNNCADCGATKPEWAAINLCVVFCKRCAVLFIAGSVRFLLHQLFLELGNDRANQFWAANVPPSEALSVCSSSEERRRFITAKYREGKYRRYHALFGNQKELDNDLHRTMNRWTERSVDVLRSEAGLELGVLRSEAGVELGVLRSEAGVELGVLRSEAGVELGVLRSEAGVELGVLRSEAGLELGVLRSEAGVELGVLRSEAGVELDVLRSEAGVELDVLRSEAGVELGVLRSEAGVELDVLRSEAGVELDVLRSEAGVELGVLRSEAVVEMDVLLSQR